MGAADVLDYTLLKGYEREFAEQYFNRKMDELRGRLQAEQKPAVPQAE